MRAVITDQRHRLLLAVLHVDGHHELVAVRRTGNLCRDAVRQHDLTARSSARDAVRKARKNGEQQSVVIMARLSR
jgi:hypothetical protein